MQWKKRRKKEIMKYFILLSTLFLTSCYTCERLELCNKKLEIAQDYNKEIKAGKIVEHKKSETNEIFFYEFKSQISNREINNIFFYINEFKTNYELIGKFEFASNILYHKEVFKKDIEQASREIGAKYTLAYKFHRVGSINDYKNKAYVYSGSKESIYYLILFFVDRDG